MNTAKNKYKDVFEALYDNYFGEFPRNLFGEINQSFLVSDKIKNDINEIKSFYIPVEGSIIISVCGNVEIEARNFDEALLKLENTPRYKWSVEDIDETDREENLDWQYDKYGDHKYYDHDLEEYVRFNPEKNSATIFSKFSRLEENGYQQFILGDKLEIKPGCFLTKNQPTFNES